MAAAYLDLSKIESKTSYDTETKLCNIESVTAQQINVYVNLTKCRIFYENKRVFTYFSFYKRYQYCKFFWRLCYFFAKYLNTKMLNTLADPANVVLPCLIIIDNNENFPRKP